MALEDGNIPRNTGRRKSASIGLSSWTKKKSSSESRPTSTSRIERRVKSWSLSASIPRITLTLSAANRFSPNRASTSGESVPAVIPTPQNRGWRLVSSKRRIVSRGAKLTSLRSGCRTLRAFWVKHPLILRACACAANQRVPPRI